MPSSKRARARPLVRGLATLVLAAACGRERGPEPRGPGVVKTVYYDSWSDVPQRVQWVVRTDAEWAAARVRIGRGSGRMEAELRPDLGRETLVIATAGGGSSGAPAVDFEEYRDAGGTRYVFVRYYMTGCDAAADVTQAYVVGTMPRWTGAVRLVSRWAPPDCTFF